jgi:anti-sigma B factor antagonist
MNVTFDDRGEVSVVAVAGSIDALTAPQLTAAFEECVHSGQVRLVADFSGVEYTSSAGLRALLGTMKGARVGGGDLRLAGVREEVNRVLEMSGFTTILKVFDTVDEAVASFE